MDADKSFIGNSALEIPAASTSSSVSFNKAGNPALIRVHPWFNSFASINLNNSSPKIRVHPPHYAPSSVVRSFLCSTRLSASNQLSEAVFRICGPVFHVFFQFGPCPACSFLFLKIVVFFDAFKRNWLFGKTF